MAYRSILLHVDAGERCAVRVGIARELAERHDAAVSAAFTAAPRVPRDSPVLFEGSSSMRAVRLEPEVQRHEKARRLFDAAQPGPRVAWLELHDEEPVTGFMRKALTADLLVLGQDRLAPADPAVPADFAQTTIMDTGTPAIVVPNTGQWDAVGRIVLVAWKPTPQAARAVRAALPLLRDADEVHVASWGHGPREIQTWLWRHGIDPHFHHAHESPSQIGERMLSRAADLDADLLVMGCYGHHPVREGLLGGASRTVLASMTLPVLMAH